MGLIIPGIIVVMIFIIYESMNSDLPPSRDSRKCQLVTLEILNASMSRHPGDPYVTPPETRPYDQVLLTIGSLNNATN